MQMGLYYMFKKSCPILWIKLLYKMGHDFLAIQYQFYWRTEEVKALFLIIKVDIVWYRIIPQVPYHGFLTHNKKQTAELVDEILICSSSVQHIEISSDFSWWLNYHHGLTILVWNLLVWSYSSPKSVLSVVQLTVVQVPYVPLATCQRIMNPVL